jgi:hypothetical protein
MAWMARPKKAEAERREAQQKVRLTFAEQADLERFAAHHGLTVAEYMRRRALDYRLPSNAAGQRQTALLATALMRLGVNLNQIAHRLNSGGREPAYLPALIARIEAELDTIYGPGSDERRPVF